MDVVDLANNFARHASKVLMVLSTAGLFAGAWAWRLAVRRDFLLAFLVVVTGTGIAQTPVYIGGMLGWGPDLVLLSGLARCIQTVGAILFMRATFKGKCPDWTWVAALCVSLLITAVL